MTPEFSRPYRLGAAESRSIELRANATECAALAERFRILGIDGITAQLTLSPARGGVTVLRGSLQADVVQECVVSLEPVAQHVSAKLDLRLLPAGMSANDEDPNSPDEIETHNDQVDLGEVVAEQLALSLDPFPRAPDAAIPPELAGESNDSDAHLEPDANLADTPPEAPNGNPNGRPNPFAALARLKRN